MAVAFVGAGSTFTNKATTATFDISTGSVSVGDTVVLRVGARFASTTAATVTASDTGGHTYTALGSNTVASTAHFYLLAAQITSAGTFTVTVNFGTSPSAVAAATDRFSGASLTTDGGDVGGTASATGSLSTTTFSTAAAGDLLVTGVALAQVAQTLTGQPASWQTLSNPATTGGGNSSNIAILGGYLAPQSAAGSVAWTGSISPNTAIYDAYTVALQQGSGGGGGGGGTPVSPPIQRTRYAASRASVW